MYTFVLYFAAENVLSHNYLLPQRRQHHFFRLKNFFVCKRSDFSGHLIMTRFPPDPPGSNQVNPPDFGAIWTTMTTNTTPSLHTSLSWKDSNWALEIHLSGCAYFNFLFIPVKVTAETDKTWLKNSMSLRDSNELKMSKISVMRQPCTQHTL